MKDVLKSTNRIAAMLLSGMLVIGSVPVLALGTEIEVEPEQVMEAVVEDEGEEAIESYTVILDANGGYFTNEWDDSLNMTLETTETVTKVIPLGRSVSSFPVMEQENAVVSFMGWSLERDGELVSQGDEEYTPVDNCVLYAVWQVEEVPEDSDETDIVESDQPEDATEVISAEDQQDTVSSEEESSDITLDEADNQERIVPENDDQADQSLDIMEEGKEDSVRSDAAKSVVESGECGADVSWTLDEEGTLTISGTGSISGNWYPENIPWYNSRQSIKKIIITDGVTAIGDNAFYDCSNVTSITIASSVKTIGLQAISDCVKLIDVDIPEGVISIGKYAFSGCSSLKSMVIPGSVKSIGDYAFYYCTNLDNISIPEGVTSIGAYAFAYSAYSFSDPRSITIPSSLTDIGDYAFARSNFTSITIQEGVKSIGRDSFRDCNKLTSVTIPSSMEKIGQGAFYSCGELISITIPENVTDIEKNAFACCNSLTNIFVQPNNNVYSSVDGVLFNKDQTSLVCCPGGKSGSYTIPSGTTNIENFAFQYCRKLKSIIISDGVINIGDNAFEVCYLLSSITIPESVVSIGNYAFSYCSSLTKISIPQNVSCIESSTFSWCKELKSILIPKSVTSIGNYAFSNCSSLTDVYYTGNEDDWGKVSIKDKNDPLLNAALHFSKEIDISLDEKNYVQHHTGSEITPTPIVKDSDNKTLELNVDYTLSYSNNIEPGIATITANGMGDYEGQCVSVTFEIVDIYIDLEQTYEGDKNETLVISAGIFSEKVTPDSSNVTWTLTPSNGHEADISLGSTFVKKSGESRYIISMPVTVSAAGDYNLTVSFNGVSATAKVVIGSSIKAKFLILRQNELKEYYTYYNGAEMKPGFTAEMDGENVSLDRLTYHYEDNDKPGIAKLVIDTLDGNAVKSETKFLILPGKVELTKVKSENPGECTVSFVTDAALFDYEVDVQLDGKSIEGYPDVIRDISNGNSGSLTSSISKYICPLKENETYKIRVRACLKVDGRTLSGEWNEADAKILAVNLMPANGFKAADCNAMWCTVDFKNADGSDSKIELTGEGYAELHDADSGEVVERILLDKTSTNIDIIGGKISFLFSSGTKPRNINEGNSSSCLLEPGHTYYVTISDDAVRYPDHRTMFGGFTSPDRWVQTTVDVSYPPFFNFGEELPDELFKQIFDPICWKKAKKECSGKNGCCYGLCYAVMQWDSDAQMRKATSSGNMADLQADSPIKETTFKKYCQLAHILQSKSSLSSQKTWNRFKYQEIYDAVKDGDSIIIGIRFKNKNGNEEGHAVYPICINPENENEIIVYDSNCPMSQELGNRPSFVHCLKLIKENGKFTGWEYIDHGTTFDNAVNLTYSTPGDIFELNNANDWNILISNWFLSSPDLIRAFSDTLGANGEEQPDEDGLYYYWTNQDDISLSTEGLGENAFVRFSDGYNVLSVIEEGDASIHLDLSAMKASVTPMEDSPLEVSLGYCNYMDHDSNRDIAIQAHVSDTATFSQDDDGWSLTGSDPGTVRIQLSSEKDAIINTEETSILSSSGNLELRKNNDILQVYEKSEEDESPAKIVGELKEPVIPHTSIENAQISGIVDKTFTGEQVLQEIVVENNGISLVYNEDYRLSYSDNINVGTATVTITGIGNYTGSKTIAFTIKPVGWYQENDEWFYYKSDGEKLTNGWAENSAGWYWLDEEGKIIKSKWVKSGGYWYYLGVNGVMTTGWQKIGNIWYYFNEGGAMTTGWQKIGNIWYYFNEGGAMTTGWQKIGNVWYYMNTGGAMTTGWQKIGNVWYYMNTGGAMTTGWQSINGKWYYFNGSGAMVTGWQKLGNTWYYFTGSGAMQTGWLKLGKYWYYFKTNGAMVTGKQLIKGKWYTFSSSGVMQ